MEKSWSLENITIIKDFLSENLTEFKILDKRYNGPYWFIQFSNGDVIVEIKGDIAFEVNIIIDNSTYPLWSYNKRVNSYMDTNKNNIIFQLNILKKFMK